jgi:hypothetical protein
VNDIVRMSFLEVANFHQQDLIKQAERSRLLAEAPKKDGFRIVRFVRGHLGGVMVEMGRRIEGCSARSHAPAEEVSASAALKLAR